MKNLLSEVEKKGQHLQTEVKKTLEHLKVRLTLKRRITIRNRLLDFVQHGQTCRKGKHLNLAVEDNLYGKHLQHRCIAVEN